MLGMHDWICKVTLSNTRKVPQVNYPILNSDLIAGQAKLGRIVPFITYLSHEEVSKLETICGTDVITNLTNGPLGDVF